jgi:cbb3-type cytochrome oxidase subunit 1
MLSQTGLATQMAPPFRLVLRHFLVGLLSFAILNIGLLFEAPYFVGHYFQPHLLGLTHVAALGWITMVIMGAMYQLVPVLLRVPLWSVRLANWTFWIFLIGATGTIGHMWVYAVGWGLPFSAAMALFAMGMFAFNLLATMARVREWNLSGLHLLTALVFIVLAAAFGVTLAANLSTPFLKTDHLRLLSVHAHLAFLGWVTLVIMGVALKLIPMFALAHGYSTSLARAAYGLVAFGTIGLSVAWIFGGPPGLQVFYAVLLAGGILAFLGQLVTIFRHRMRKELDVGMRHTIVSFSNLALLLLIGLYIAVRRPDVVQNPVPNWQLVYGFLAFYGFVSFIIMGQMYKILPFLTWYHRFSDRVGKESVPMLKEMFSERLGQIQFWLSLVGYAGAVVAIFLGQTRALQAAAAVLVAATTIFIWNMATVLRKR